MASQTTPRPPKWLRQWSQSPSWQHGRSARDPHPKISGLDHQARNEGQPLGCTNGGKSWKPDNGLNQTLKNMSTAICARRHEISLKNIFAHFCKLPVTIARHFGTRGPSPFSKMSKRKTCVEGLRVEVTAFISPHQM